MSKMRTALGALLSLCRKAIQSAAVASLFIAVPVAGFAQETTSRVRGVVLAPDGAPAPGLSVTITDTRTDSSRTVSTSGTGTFAFTGLSVGGPYTIRVAGGEYEGTVVTDIYTSLSDVTDFTVRLEEQTEIEEIVVTASAVQSVSLAVGPGTSFSIEDIQSMPSIQRQIRDVIRVDPRVSLGRADNGAGYGISCLGGHPRSNSITIDGAVANDGFGLNEGTGTSARFAFPIPYDTIASAAVEFAPLDVQYSQFTGCAINVVTKPGSNEFTGSAFYLFNDDSLTGDTLEGDTVITEPFEDKNWGFDISGPIIKDKLFFTVAYEETDEGGVQSLGPIGAGFANEDFVTIEQAEEIKDILQSQYNRDPGDIVRELPQTSERIFVRLDWNVNEKHRAAFTYTDLEELNLDPDDLGFDGFTFSDNFENEGIEQDTISARLFSNWTDAFSTEFRYSRFDVTDIQGPLAGGEAQGPDPKVRISVEDGAGDPLLLSGPGFFRSANDLQYQIDQLKLAGDYILGDHTLTFGYERETRDIFNLFIPNATGTLVFDSVEDLRNGDIGFAFFSGSLSGDPRDAAASFERSIDSFYIQDEWQLNSAIRLIGGIRYDSYSTDDVPPQNPIFEQRYGFANTQTFEGLDLLQPRIGLTWDLPGTAWGSTQLTLGYGVFGGGDPTVHFANAYQNFGGAIGGSTIFDAPCTGADLDAFNGGAFSGLPDCMVQAAAADAQGNTGAVAAVDPDFELPENHRFSIGLNHFTKSEIGFIADWNVRLDYIYTDHKNAVDWVDLRLSPNGVTLPDGRPQFFEVDPLQPGCNATFIGIRQGFANAGTNGGPCDDTGNSNQDILMTNGVEGSTSSVSLQLAKSFQLGSDTSLDLNIGYAYLDAEVGNPVNSSTAGSAYEEVATAVLNNVRLGPALWANEHNLVLRARLEHYFFENHPTTIGLFYQRRSGRPFSYTYEDDTVEDYFGDSDDEERVLLHVPTGPDDPLYDFSQLSAEQVSALFAFLDSSGLSRFAGGVVPKNGFDGPWSTDLDIRISQAVPLPGNQSIELFVDIENFLNLIDDDRNVRRYTNTGDIQEGVRVLEVLGDTGNTDQFVVSDWFDEGTLRDVDDSVYRIQLGFRYQFGQ